MLNIAHLTKTYGEKKAVDDLSLHIRPGEIYGFIGHNGAGKTTTLKSVAGILRFDAGEITVCGHSVKAEPLACKHDMAYIPRLVELGKLFPYRLIGPRKKAQWITSPLDSDKT